MVTIGVYTHPTTDIETNTKLKKRKREIERERERERERGEEGEGALSSNAHSVGVASFKYLISHTESIKAFHHGNGRSSNA